MKKLLLALLFLPFISFSQNIPGEGLVVVEFNAPFSNTKCKYLDKLDNSYENNYNNILRKIYFLFNTDDCEISGFLYNNIYYYYENNILIVYDKNKVDTYLNCAEIVSKTSLISKNTNLDENLFNDLEINSPPTIENILDGKTLDYIQYNDENIPKFLMKHLNCGILYNFKFSILIYLFSELISVKSNPYPNSDKNIISHSA